MITTSAAGYQSLRGHLLTSPFLQEYPIIGGWRTADADCSFHSSRCYRVGS